MNALAIFGMICFILFGYVKYLEDTEKRHEALVFTQTEIKFVRNYILHQPLTDCLQTVENMRKIGIGYE